MRILLDLEVSLFIIGLKGIEDALFFKLGDVPVKCRFIHRDIFFDLFITQRSIRLLQYLQELDPCGGKLDLLLFNDCLYIHGGSITEKILNATKLQLIKIKKNIICCDLEIRFAYLELCTMSKNFTKDTSMSDEHKTPIDGNFYKRADEIISLANSHINEKTPPADATNSLMFASSRYNAWIAAMGFKSADEMKAEKEEIIAFFTSQYKLMLEENFDNYVENFDQFIAGAKEAAKDYKEKND